MTSQDKPLWITVFGGLRIWRDKQLIDLEKTGGNKPLELLKFIIAYGGKNVSTDFAASKLWPSSDGDNAMGALSGTLLRLRKILGVQNGLVLKGGMLNLNSEVCWLDTWEFDKLTYEISRTLEQQAMTPHLAHQFIKALHNIVRGPCLLSESDLPWVYLMQDKMKTKFSRAVLGLGNYLMAEKQAADAAQLFERALELYPLSEEVCMKLMEARQAQGLTTEALLAYKRFEHILRETMNMTPSGALLEKMLATKQH